MSLKKYKAKRDFESSSEPQGDAVKASSAKALNFVVQKHAARRLHYDFRLEYKGVLVSWAVPKGPSMDPSDKRLAIKVEDHPLDYQYFEGTIPAGNYGAGTVEIWDNGAYGSHYGTSRKEVEEYIRQGLAKGHFSIILNGKKLKGEFTFQKLKQDPDDDSWIIIKKNDEYAKKNAKV